MSFIYLKRWRYYHRLIFATEPVSTTDFDIDDSKKNALIESGKQSADNYFVWFDDHTNEAHNRPEAD